VPTINLLTWNLGKHEAALTALVRHVAARSRGAEHFVVAVQESLPDYAEIQARVQAEGGTVEVVGNGGMSILCSERLEPRVAPLDDGVGLRLVLTRATFAGQRLAIVNYHGEPQGLAGAPHPVERGGIASEARWRIDEHAAGDPVIVLGDFNIRQHDPEILSRHCFSFAPEPAPSSRRSHNRDRQDVRIAYAHLPPGVHGTYRLRSSTRGTVWETLDFLAASATLAVQMQVRDELNGEPLTDGMKPTLSDHLPVAGILDL
jgi:endonuclease/exonuclease/phosphatase family metal-dependent hydrolase